MKSTDQPLVFELFPDPGPLPTKPSPKKGEQITIQVNGYPPYKETRQSLRNPTNPRHDRFIDLRQSAILAMEGRRWYDGAIDLEMTINALAFEKRQNLNAYAGGVMDSLDGSHGMSFTYLPVVYQDDCQVASYHGRLISSRDISYQLKISFM